MKKSVESGQALIALLFIVILVTTYSSAAIILVGSGNLTTTILGQGFKAEQLADSGVEEALLQLLRDPNYSGGSFVFPDGNVTVDIVNGVTKMITVTADTGSVVKEKQVVAEFVDGVMQVNSWKEI